MLLTICDVFELGERCVHLLLTQVIAKVDELLTERMAPRMLTHDELAFLQADNFGTHDFVGRFLLQHAVLMNA